MRLAGIDTNITSLCALVSRPSARLIPTFTRSGLPLRLPESPVSTTLLPSIHPLYGWRTLPRSLKRASLSGPVRIWIGLGRPASVPALHELRQRSSLRPLKRPHPSGALTHHGWRPSAPNCGRSQARARRRTLQSVHLSAHVMSLARFPPSNTPHTCAWPPSATAGRLRNA
jgi:hypothetical protein